jgi:hypothetical protein
MLVNFSNYFFLTTVENAFSVMNDAMEMKKMHFFISIQRA